MSHTEEIVGERSILDVIRTLSSNGESGKLHMRTGTTDGVFFFRNGQLVDARVGNLTGFQAMNAAASVRDASFRFDPSIRPPSFSSLKPNERIVLKQFFGIDTVAHDEQPTPVHAERPIPNDVDEVTLVAGKAPVEELAPVEEVPIPMTYQRRSTPIFQSRLVLAVLLFLVAATTAVLVYRFLRERAAPSTVAANTQPPSTPVAEQTSTPSAQQVKANNQPTSAAQDLTGKWNVVNTVNQTSLSSYKNLEIGFAVAIKQTGNGFTGEGQKVSENGRSLPASSRTPIHVKGSINGDRIEATFFEDGAMRKSNGRFMWRVDKAGGLTGTFASNAARTSGRSTATRIRSV